ncbi:MAG TPA: glutamine amidotransferase [Vicinamibacterales bacterium]|nr:glutamine amidotransferase [Vicinamibacterales bacterium]
MFESLFQFLFEYRPVVFQQGAFAFRPPAGVWVAVILGVAALIGAVASYRLLRTKAALRDRLILSGFRVAVLAVVLVCLFRPVLVVKAAVPQQNVLGILVDDSRSMQTPDWRGQPRGDFIRQTFGSKGSSLMNALSDHFVVRLFRFSSSASRIDSASGLAFDGPQTRLAGAIDGARQELAGLPLAGLVLVTDGADTTEASVADALLGPKAQAVPVFTVGVGQEALAHDIQIGRVSTPRTVLKGTSLLADAIVTQNGYAGKTVSLDIEDEGRIVGTEPVTLPADGQPASVRVRFTAKDAGPRVFTVRIAPQPGETLTKNNQREALIDVRDRRERILYFEGEPRFELKFIRRAVADDPNLQIVTLNRTADHKYYRLGIDSPDELASGFPKTREELFQYRGLILGSVEASAFTGDQLRMIADFVDVRGGGLLMLGGAHAFAEGGYAGTPVADVLPVVLGRAARRGGEPIATRVKVHPTRAGEGLAVTRLGDTDQASSDRWKGMTELTTVNAIDSVKPGATVLLAGTDDREREHPVLAYQRYGRGKAVAFTVQDSWLWQMQAGVPATDTTYEDYWRQLLRWVVDGVPDTVEPRPLTDRVEPGEAVSLTTDVVDKRFLELNDAQVVAHVTAPSGKRFDVPLTWTGARAGQYRGTFTAAEAGWYAARVDATQNGTPVGTSTTHVRAAADVAEYFDAGLHASLLRRIAQETGGRYYTPETVSALPEDLKYTGRGVTTVEARDLWHMPIVLVLILGLMCGEWGYRRHRGLA